MHRPLYHINWMLQLLVGSGLFLVSMIVEYAVLKAFFTGASLLALALALFLEIGKGMSIIWHRYLSFEDAPAYPFAARVVSHGFRWGLVFLSMLCTLSYLGVRLDRPALGEVRQQDLQQLQEGTRDARERLQAETNNMIAQQREDQQAELRHLLAPYQSRVEKLARQLDSEMNNVVRGTFIGNRYRALETRLKEAKEEEAKLTAELSARHARERQALQQQVQQMLRDGEAKISRQHDATLAEIRQDHYANDERVQHPMIASLANLFHEVLGWSVTPLQLVFSFSVLISSLVELGIMQAFGTATIGIYPLMRAQHQSEIDIAVKATELDSRTRQNNMEAAAETEQIKTRFEQSLDAAREAASSMTAFQ